MADRLPGNVVERPMPPGGPAVASANFAHSRDWDIHPGQRGHRQSKSEHRAFRLEAEKKPAHGLEMSLAALQLLHDSVDVAEPPLEPVALEDRRRTGGVVGSVDDADRLVDG